MYLIASVITLIIQLRLPLRYIQVKCELIYSMRFIYCAVNALSSLYTLVMPYMEEL